MWRYRSISLSSFKSQTQVKAEVRELMVIVVQVLYLVFSPTRSDWWLCCKNIRAVDLDEGNMIFYSDIYKPGLCDPPTQWTYLQSSLSHSRPVWIIMCSLLDGTGWELWAPNPIQNVKNAFVLTSFVCLFLSFVYTHFDPWTCRSRCCWQT